ncbi:ankyrin repeat domain-containing protein [Endozoicomonas sp. GU-1]|uniref:ankyrin repeat domain-containing protein n=1 Tax=Endozoicomonas sp. GU-1 TaxID=3009078 RepID=UPI0022B50C22|nr:ankyrin repeat domain-containing protein [Endozoicomonas sp. GU-1]WBA79895.1 ankyrin repeat domain-containing protein [Endozoicomonas sp. GU-1]WBA87470.1 ankyrin repeat domain-containing protein [Endozoicomonas sp. GU-1]
MDSQKETSLDKRQCSECKEPALPLIPKDGSEVGENKYCESSPILNTCRTGDWELLEDLLGKNEACANQKYYSALDFGERYPLAVAIQSKNQSKNAELIQTLVNHGADVNARVGDGETVLHLAARNGNANAELIRTLVNHGADVNARNNDGETVLHLAARNGNAESVRALLDIDPFLAIDKNNDGKTALHLALNAHDHDCIERKEILKTALDNPALSKADRFDDPKNEFIEQLGNDRSRLSAALHIAVDNGNIKMVKKLLTSDRSLAKEKDHRGDTVLVNAARKGRTEFVKALLAIAPSLAKDDDSVSKALESAAFSGHKDTVETLWNINPSLVPKVFISAIKDNLAEVVDVFLNIEDKDKDSLAKQEMALHFAIGNNCRRTVDLLLDFDISLAKHRDSRGLSAFELAIQANTDIAIKMLEKDSGLAKEVDNRNQTPLHLAAKYGDLALVKKLLKIDPNLVYKEDINRLRPLENAANEGNADIIKKLLKNNQTLATQKVNRPAIHLAAYQGHSDVVKALLEIERPLAEKMARMVSGFGDTPLHTAATYGHVEVVKALLNFDRSLAEEKNDNGCTALKRATDALQAFDDSHAEEKNDNGCTAPDRSKRTGFTKVIELLQKANQTRACRQPESERKPGGVSNLL